LFICVLFYESIECVPDDERDGDVVSVGKFLKKTTLSLAQRNGQSVSVDTILLFLLGHPL
jgi:hypothetical protein